MKMTRFLLLGIYSAFFVIIGACQPVEPMLKEYLPEESSLFRITFSYPSNWDLEIDPDASKKSSGMTAFEPYPVGEGINEESRLAGISVWLDSKPRDKMQERLDSYLADIEALERLELRDDRTLQIDGHEARWLTIVNSWESTDPGTTYIAEFIYLLTEDRYYTITLYIPESETNGRFHTEFKALIESIKILP